MDNATPGAMSLAGVLGAALGAPLVFLIAGVMCVAAGLRSRAMLPAIRAQDSRSVEAAEPPESRAKHLEAATVLD